MSRRNIDYKKLSGRLFSFIIVKRLWLASDHVLSVESSFGQEQYLRFYFRDIQAIVLQKTNLHIVWSCIWGLAGLFCFIMAAFVIPGTPYVSGFSTGLFTLFLAVNLLRGPTCAVYLQTAVQVQRLTGLPRLKAAQKAVSRLKTRIIAEQGALDSKQTAYRARQTHAFSSPAQPGASRLSAGGAKESFNPLFHNLLFALLITAGVCRAVQLWMPLLSVALIDLLLMALTLALAMVALVRNYHQIKNTSLSLLTWSVLIVAVVHSVVYYGFYLVVSFENPGMAYNHWRLLKLFLETMMGGDPTIRVLRVSVAGISLTLGVIGIVLLRTGGPSQTTE